MVDDRVRLGEGAGGLLRILINLTNIKYDLFLPVQAHRDRPHVSKIHIGVQVHPAVDLLAN